MIHVYQSIAQPCTQIRAFRIGELSMSSLALHIQGYPPSLSYFCSTILVIIFVLILNVCLYFNLKKSIFPYQTSVARRPRELNWLALWERGMAYSLSHINHSYTSHSWAPASSYMGKKADNTVLQVCYGAP